VDGKRYVATALCFELGHLPATVGDDDGFVPVLNEVFADFECPAFDTAGVELWEDLDDFHGEIRDERSNRVRRSLLRGGMREVNFGFVDVDRGHE
jgi:hypothetical protein